MASNAFYRQGRGGFRGGKGRDNRGRGGERDNRGGFGGRRDSMMKSGGRRGGGRGHGGRERGEMKGEIKVFIEPHRHEGAFIAKGKENSLVTKNIVPGEAVYYKKRICIQANIYREENDIFDLYVILLKYSSVLDELELLKLEVQ